MLARQDWVTDGAVSVAEGESLRLKAIRIKLTGTEASNYNSYIRFMLRIPAG